LFYDVVSQIIECRMLGRLLTGAGKDVEVSDLCLIEVMCLHLLLETEEKPKVLQ